MEVVLTAVQADGDALEFSDKLRNNRQVVQAAVANSRTGRALSFASWELRGDKEMAQAAVMKHGASLKYAAPELRDNREVVLAALAASGCALQFASPRLRADRDIVQLAVANHWSALYFASDELRTDKSLLLMALKQNGRALDAVCPEVLFCEDFWRAAQPLLEEVVVLKVSTLSGRSCLSVWGADDFVNKAALLKRCSSLLGLDYRMAGQADLLVQRTSELLQISGTKSTSLPAFGLKPGLVHELQLIMSS